MTPEIGLAQVFDPDQAFRWIVKINFRRANFVRGQEFRDLDVMAVLFPLEIVLNQNDRLLRRTTDPIKLPVRSAFLDRRDLDVHFFETREMDPRLAEKKFRCRCHGGRLRLYVGSGQYSCGGEIGKRFVRPATELCSLKSCPLRPGSRLRPSKSRR